MVPLCMSGGKVGLLQNNNIQDAYRSKVKIILIWLRGRISNDFGCKHSQVGVSKYLKLIFSGNKLKIRYHLVIKVKSVQWCFLFFYSYGRRAGVPWNQSSCTGICVLGTDHVCSRHHKSTFTLRPIQHFTI